MVTQGYDLPWHKITIRFLLALKAYQECGRPKFFNHPQWYPQIVCRNNPQSWQIIFLGLPHESHPLHTKHHIL